MKSLASSNILLLLDVLLVVVIFYPLLFRVHHTAHRQINGDLFLPMNAWLVASQLFLIYHIYLLPLDFNLVLFCTPFFPSYSVPDCVAGWMAFDVLLSFSFFHSSLLLFILLWSLDFASYLFSLLDSSTNPFFCLATDYSALY